VAALPAGHRRRLLALWRSAGWPAHDAVELDLLAAGFLARAWDPQGRETLRVTDAGIAAMALQRRRHQASHDGHEALVGRVAAEMHRAGRLVWCGLAVRAPLVDADGRTRWSGAIPDVFSIRNTTVEGYLEPVVHEIKVTRSDLLADLRSASKREAYLAVSGACWYVLRAGIGGVDDVPEDFGVLEARADGFELLRPARRRAVALSLATWMALARADAWRPPPDDEPQRAL
jgi:hypothetical protein